MAVSGFNSRVFDSPLALKTFVTADPSCAAIISIITDNSGKLVLFYSTIAPVVSSGSPPIIINFTSSGGETDFVVPIGTTMANDTYALLWAPQGISSLPALDLPNILAGDRTTTQFRVQSSALTSGDKLTFVVIPS